MAIDQFNGHKVLLPSAVEQDQSVQFPRLEHEIDVDARVGSKHRQTYERVLRPERDRTVQAVCGPFDEFRGHLGKNGFAVTCFLCVGE